MQSYYVTFYLQYAADSEAEAEAKARQILHRISQTEQPEEAVIVAVGLSPQPE